jgi:hypothetical protein
MLQLMKFRFLSLLFLLSIALPSCTMQKRSIMPGWHIELQGDRTASQEIEKSGDLIDNISDTCAEVLNQDSEPLTNVRSSEKQVIQRDPLIPVKSLMALPPQMTDLSLLKTLDAATVTDSSEAKKSSRGLLRAVGLRAVGLRAVGPWRLLSYDLQHIGAIRFLLFLLGLPLTLLGVVCLLLVGWDVAFLLPGLALLTAGIVALKWAFTANARWGERKRVVGDSVAKDSNQVQREAMERARDDARRVRAERSQARKVKRQAFFQTPAIKTALGFVLIFVAYFLLF